MASVILVNLRGREQTGKSLPDLAGFGDNCRKDRDSALPRTAWTKYAKENMRVAEAGGLVVADRATGLREKP
jgi:hypothetical protein